MKLVRFQAGKDSVSDRRDRDVQFLKGMENANSEMINFIQCHETTDLTQAAESPFSHSRSHCSVILGGLKQKEPESNQTDTQRSQSKKFKHNSKGASCLRRILMVVYQEL